MNYWFFTGFYGVDKNPVKNPRSVYFHLYEKDPKNFKLLNYQEKLKKLGQVFEKEKGDLAQTFFSLMPPKRLNVFEELTSKIIGYDDASTNDTSKKR